MQPNNHGRIFLNGSTMVQQGYNTDGMEGYGNNYNNEQIDDFVFVSSTSPNHTYSTRNKSSVVPTYESSDESTDDEDYTDTS